MMTDHDPIGYELTDEGADPDSHLYPVDSATRHCCGGIGGHSPDCAALSDCPPSLAIPAGPYDPEDGQRPVVAYMGMGSEHHLIGVWAQQDAAGQLSEVAINMHEPNELTAAQARELAGLLFRAADLADQWTGKPGLSPIELMADAFSALRAARAALLSTAGDAADHLQIALDAVNDAAEVLR